MFIIDAPRPVSRKVVLERFGLADTFKRSSLNLFDKLVDAAQYLFVRFLPIEVVFPGVL